MLTMQTIEFADRNMLLNHPLMSNLQEEGMSNDPDFGYDDRTHEHDISAFSQLERSQVNERPPSSFRTPITAK